MSNAKRQLEGKAFKGKKSSLQRKMERLQAVDGSFEKSWPALWSAYNDYETPLIELRVYIRDRGDFLGLVKREVGVKDQIIFAGADDFLECLDSLNTAIRMEKWKADKPAGSSSNSKSGTGKSK